MAFLQFDMLRPDGALEPRLIPTEKIKVVRPLSDEETKFSVKLRSGYFGAIPYNAYGTRYERKDNRTDIEKTLVMAQIARTDVAHGDTKSILETTDEARYCLARSVEELTASVPELVVLGKLPKAAPAPM
jgi:hypothetical protein